MTRNKQEIDRKYTGKMTGNKQEIDRKFTVSSALVYIEALKSGGGSVPAAASQQLAVTPYQSSAENCTKP